MIHRIRYNPAFLPEDALLAGFSVRQDELRELLGSIRRSGASANEHVLVVGARGSGKSTLLRVAGANVRRDPTLGAAWFPLFYAEESYEVASAAEFWLEALLHLGDATRDNRWATEWRDARVLRDDTRLEARALAALRRFHHESGKRLLLFVENFDMLVGQIPERDAAAIRKVLQGEPWVMLVASAVRRFPGVDEPDQPMFELFRRLQLDPLDAPAVDTAWHGLTGNHIGERRAEAVRILTGGNLRMLTLLAGFARGTTLGDLMGSLEALVDEHTDHFKDNIEALDGQNRRAFLAAAALWRPASVKELADEARLDARVVSTVVSRLVDQGRLEIVGKRGKNNLYQVAERLYNIYYLMRRRGGPDASVRALVDFILHYYEPTDLPCVVARIAEDGCAPGGAWRAEHLHAVAGTVEALVAQPAALAAVLGQLPGAFFEQEDRPAGVKRIERSPRGLAALLRRPDGEKYVAEAERVVHRAFQALVRGSGVGTPGFAEKVELAMALLERAGASRLPAEALTVAVMGSSREELEELLGQPGVTERLASIFRLGWLLSQRERSPADIDWALGSGPLEPDEDDLDELRVTTFVLHPARHAEGVTFAAAALARTGGRPVCAGLVARSWFAESALSPSQIDLLAAIARDYADDPSIAPWALMALAPRGKLDRAAVSPGDSVWAAGALVLDAGVRRDLEAAWVAALAAREAMPSEAHVQSYLAHAALWTGRTTEAARLARDLVQARPDWRIAWQLLGAADPEEAAQRVSREQSTGGECQLAVLSGAAASITPPPGALVELAERLLPTDLRSRVTLGTTLAKAGRVDDAARAWRPLLQDLDFVSANLETATGDVVRLAASGAERVLLEGLRDGPTALALAPAVVALQLLTGEEVAAPAEVSEIARDIERRVRTLRANGGIWASRVVLDFEFPVPPTPTLKFVPPPAPKPRRARSPHRSPPPAEA